MNRVPENLNFILLNVGFSEPNESWNWKGIHSPFARIYYVTKGNAKTYINNKVYELKPHHLYLTPPFTLHDDECDDRFSLYYIHFYEKAIKKESIFDTYDFPVEMPTGKLQQLLIERLLEINPDRHLQFIDPKLYDNMPTFSRYVADNRKMPAYSVIETQGILHQLISGFFENANTKPGYIDVRISKCLRYIHENTEEDISVSFLANLSCISEDHLIRVFKKEMNCTPLKYINIKKIEKAQLLLITTDMPIRDVAMELSIDNASYFNRIFKKYTGKTPMEYRDSFVNP